MLQSFSKKRRVFIYAIIIGSFLAALKNIFVCICVDEEYQVTMAYRLIRGEKMFVDLWDPHQTSAFLSAFLMWIFEGIFHSLTGVVVWLRVCGTLIHLGVSYMVFRVVNNFETCEHSFLLATIYFNLLPKNSILPDYSIMFVWSLTLISIHLFYLFKESRLIHALICGFWMCVMVLSYPAALLIFPVVLVILIRNKDKGLKYAFAFVGACVVGGAGYLSYVLHVTGSVERLLYLIECILEGNRNYTDLTPAYKLAHYAKEFVISIALCGAYLGCAKLVQYIALKKNKMEATVSQWMFLAVAIGAVHHVLHWVLMLWDYEQGYNYSLYFMIFSFAFVALRRIDSLERKTTVAWCALSIVGFGCVLALTDLTVYVSAKYMIPGVIIGIFAILNYAEKKDNRTYQKHASALLFLLCFTTIFVKGWQYQDSGGVMANVLSVRGINKQGPTKYILTEYMDSYIADSTVEEMETHIKNGSSLLVVDKNPIAYMYKDVKISSYTTICDGAYNEILLEYWKERPDKYPDVIMVSCWYGNLQWNPDSWIINWINEEYNASKIIDGKYYRYYFR